MRAGGLVLVIVMVLVMDMKMDVVMEVDGGDAAVNKVNSVHSIA